MVESGISVKDTGIGLQLNLDGEMFRKIAHEWEQGKLRPFYTHLKDFYHYDCSCNGLHSSSSISSSICCFSSILSAAHRGRKLQLRK